MDYLILKTIHLTGLAMTFMGLAGVLASKVASEAPFKKRWIFHVSHGVGMLMLVFSGFALAHQLGALNSIPGWLRGKFVIWLLAGGAMALAIRFSRFTGLVLIFFAGLVLAAAWLSIQKPF
ncbi:hypothetical protein [Pedosphaera parvula]|uniref:Uncharacterized protein n=1 Tax=Pedosphaera parvula (strain Ellin514) TaxID=320771 RepID=B9XD90_PEDPL|nr:hypothetical protein [Pedosphaera parvula]EEF62036.1 conserved hypothetical protein [Pedosphaera parvula Ellin514]